MAAQDWTDSERRVRILTKVGRKEAWSLAKGLFVSRSPPIHDSRAGFDPPSPPPPPHLDASPRREGLTAFRIGLPWTQPFWRQPIVAGARWDGGAGGVAACVVGRRACFRPPPVMCLRALRGRGTTSPWPDQRIMQPSALMLPNCQWRAFDGAPFAIDQDIWRIQNPLSVCDIGNASSHQFLALLSVLATARPHLVTFISRKASIVSPGTRTIRPVARLGRIRPKTTGKGCRVRRETKTKSHLWHSITVYTKKDPSRSFCKAPSCKSPEARVSPLQTISERTWLFPRQASATLVPSANRSLGRPGGSANLPTKIQAVPAAAPPLSLLAALGFICGDNPPPPQALGSPALFITTAIPYLPPTEGYVAKPPHHAIQNRNDRSTLQSIVLEFPKITIENIYSDEEHSERGATGKTTAGTIG